MDLVLALHEPICFMFAAAVPNVTLATQAVAGLQDERSEIAAEDEAPIISAGFKPKGFGIYALPVFPVDIVERLRRGDRTILTQRGERARVLRVLADDLLARVGMLAFPC
jgi:hypothetical protein